jgi:hypothetical protein
MSATLRHEAKRLIGHPGAAVERLGEPGHVREKLAYG